MTVASRSATVARRLVHVAGPSSSLGVSTLATWLASVGAPPYRSSALHSNSSSVQQLAAALSRQSELVTLGLWQWAEDPCHNNALPCVPSTCTPPPSSTTTSTPANDDAPFWFHGYDGKFEADEDVANLRFRVRGQQSSASTSVDAEDDVGCSDNFTGVFFTPSFDAAVVYAAPIPASLLPEEEEAATTPILSSSGVFVRRKVLWVQPAIPVASMRLLDPWEDAAVANLLDAAGGNWSDVFRSTDASCEAVGTLKPMGFRTVDADDVSGSLTVSYCLRGVPLPQTTSPHPTRLAVLPSHVLRVVGVLDLTFTGERH